MSQFTTWEYPNEKLLLVLDISNSPFLDECLSGNIHKPQLFYPADMTGNTRACAKGVGPGVPALLCRHTRDCRPPKGEKLHAHLLERQAIFFVRMLENIVWEAAVNRLPQEINAARPSRGPRSRRCGGRACQDP